MISDETIAEVREHQAQRDLEATVRRIDIREILRDPERRREMMVDVIIATQAREGIETTREQAARAYDAVQRELASKGDF